MSTDATAGAVSPLARFRGYLERGQLAYQFDRESGQAVFYPRVIGPVTGTADLEWRVSAGLGTVHAVTVISPRGEPAYDVALIDMDEGFRLMSRVEDVPAEQVGIGMRVRVRIHRSQDGAAPYPVFVPEGTAR
jgi:uncharacterized OB-fold protein